MPRARAIECTWRDRSSGMVVRRVAISVFPYCWRSSAVSPPVSTWPREERSVKLAGTLAPGKVRRTASGRQGPHGGDGAGGAIDATSVRILYKRWSGGFGQAWRRVPGRRALAAVIHVDGPSPIVKISPSISLTTLKQVGQSLMGSEISIRLPSGSRTYIDRIRPVAPVRMTGPSIIGHWHSSSRPIAAAKGHLEIKQRSRDPGVGASAFGSNSLPLTCTLIFCPPKLNAFRSTGGVPPMNVSSAMPITRV